MKEFNWKEVEYPCLGIAENDEVICFIEYGKGYVVQQTVTYRESGHYSSIWNMVRFKPYTKPTPKDKLWYWELLDPSGGWFMYEWRMTEKDIQSKFIGHKIVKIEALGYIEED